MAKPNKLVLPVCLIAHGDGTSHFEAVEAAYAREAGADVVAEYQVVLDAEHAEAYAAFGAFDNLLDASLLERLVAEAFEAGYKARRAADAATQ